MATETQEQKCERCLSDGLEPNEDCPFYGEPNGCNSPTYGIFPTPMNLVVSKKETTTQGNPAMMREALEAYIALWDRGTMNDLDELKRVIGKMRAALAAPLRNCDVGTVKEQYDRFILFCRQYKRCNGCPFEELFDAKNGIRTPHICGLAWAQMPYEEGGKE